VHPTWRATSTRRIGGWLLIILETTTPPGQTLVLPPTSKRPKVTQDQTEGHLLLLFIYLFGFPGNQIFIQAKAA
jgi:hypothetical protein